MSGADKDRDRDDRSYDTEPAEPLVEMIKDLWAIRQGIVQPVRQIPPKFNSSFLIMSEK